MSILQTYLFNNAINFNLTNTEISAAKARLSKIANTGLLFNQPFTNDTGFTYDSAKSEFVGALLRQKDQRPSGSSFFAPYTSSVNAVWGLGTLTGTLTGAGVLSSGYLELLGGVASKYIDYSGTSHVGIQTGCVRVKVRPGYSGSPATLQGFFTASSSSGSNGNLTRIHHQTNGHLSIHVWNSAGTAIVTNLTLGVWSPVAGTTYEIELNWDVTTGGTRLFVDGVQFGATSNATGTRNSTIALMRSGESNTVSTQHANFSIQSLLLFTTVQHTSNYTPSAELPDTIYVSDIITSPTFTYSQIGSLQAFTSFATTESSTVQYIMNGLYWNGSVWVASNNSFAQSNTKAQVLANIATLPASNTLIIKVLFTDQDTQANIDDLTVTYTGQQYTSNGTITPTQAINTRELIEYLQTETETANAKIRIHLTVDGQAKYWDSAAWVNSDGTYAQSNIESDFNTNIPSLVFGSNSTVFLVWVLNTSNQQETAEIESASVEYDFGGVDEALAKCLIWGYYKDLSGQPVSGADVTFSLKRDKGQYKEANSNIVEKSIVVQTDTNGYFEAELIRSSEYEGSGVYKMKITKSTVGLKTGEVDFSVPDADDKNITDLLTAI